MHCLFLSTADVLERDRFSYWREAVNQIGLPGERDRPSETPFEGELAATFSDSLTRFRFRSSKYRVTRQSREIEPRCGDDRIWLYREIGEGSLHEDHGREFVTRSGDVIIGDPSLPGKTEALGNYDHEIWSFPRSFLDPHLPATRHPQLLQLSGHEGLSGILVSYLEALSGQVNSLAESEAAMVADNFCRLIAVAFGTRTAEHSQTISETRLEEAKRYIRAHLPDPRLTPAMAAAAMKISVRHLHGLFEPTGTSFGEYVLRRRLEECRITLISAAGASRSVTDIAFAWGFNSLATFYRAFGRTFGTTPTELRRAADRSS